MGYRETLQVWVLEALSALGGSGAIEEVAREIWHSREPQLREGPGFFSWQYDMRWAAQKLRERGKLGLRKESGKSVWYLKP
ncbi:hypothetical protein [uncultured Sphingomonas sp.]|uniref:hypothetical protein n=1 Tax=uncultured Sphingomonas sp. TaxID=158754 RepID=UPI0025E07C16|nr:hypothetical protein [uncultured Sphingomonas sp.]